MAQEDKRKKLLRPKATPGNAVFNAGAFFSASDSLQFCVCGENILDVKNGKEKESKIKENSAFRLVNSSSSYSAGVLNTVM